MKLDLKLTLPLLVALAYAPNPAWAAPLLGSNVASFAVLGAESVSNVPTSVVVGNVGVSAGSSITGFNSSPGSAVSDLQVTGGSVHTTTAVAGFGQAELTTARSNFDSMGAGTLLGADLSGLTLTPGVYTVPFGTTNLSGTVTLDGLGNANAFWLFQMESSLITSSGSVVNVTNAGSGAGVFWNVRSSATLNTTTSFEGNILALTSIFLRTGATISCGRALADNGEVTMDQNTVNSQGCEGTGEEGSNGLSGGGLEFVPGGGTGGTGGTVSVIPAPGTLALVSLGLVGLLGSRKKSLTVA